MIDTLEFFEELKEAFEPVAAEKLAKLFGRLYKELSNTVTKAELEKLSESISELTEAIKETNVSINELTEAQKRTEERLNAFEKSTEENFNRVWSSINELTEAQKRTEERLNAFEKSTEEGFNRVWSSINELTEAQKRTEERLNAFEKSTEENFNRVWSSINELTEAQKRTEERLNAFEKSTEENFNRVWSSINELTEAQKRTEKEVRELARSLKETRQMVGNLSDTVGYSLEDRAIKSLPQLLKDRYGIEVTERLVRKYVRYNGKFDEINIFGKGKRKEKEVYIIGEAKARLSKSDIDDLLKLSKRLTEKGIIKGDLFLFMVTYTARPESEDYSHKMGVEVIWSYEV